MAPYIEAQHAGQAEHSQQQAVDQRGLFAAPAEGIHADRNDVFQHGQHGGEAGKNHKQEEQRAPQAAALHIDKDVRQRFKDQRRALIGLYAKGEASREDDRARHQRHQRVQRADAHGLARQGVLLAHIAAKDLHGRNAQAQGEKRLVHRVHNQVAQAIFADAVHRGQKIELHALLRARQRQAVHSQQRNQRQQSHHHDLGNALQTVAQPKAAHHKTQQHHNLRPDRHFAGRRQKRSKHAANGLRRHFSRKGARQEAAEIADHPARHGGVIHHQQIAARQAEPAMDVPLLPRLFQLFIR